MDKNAIKKYAVWARREFIERVSQKALQYGVSADGKADLNADNVNGKLLTDVEKKQRQALIRKISEQGYEQVMEEVAYTWFNRFAALRFMEINGYLPSHVRVFTNDDGEFKPQILSEAIHLEIDGLKMDKVYELKNANKNEELFKYLLITQCNALSSILPGMFQKIDDYTELLLPDNLLREGSVIEQMVNPKDGIPESDWTDQVQIIGWLYQYYNTEPKDKVFADLKKNIKITKETIPAATQLFTPDWIVHYMVENSLGRLWLEGHPNDALKSEWKYYLDEAEQKTEVQAQLETIRKEYAAMKPEEIRCIDPCMGSGHILCVLFDTLVRIYEDYGYTEREAAASIVENNLWGLDIDERAAQLSYFAVMMKARQYDRRFFFRGIQPHVYAVEESNGLKYDGDYGDFLLDKAQQETLDYMLDAFKDAKEYGSILDVEQRDYDGFLKAWRLTAEQTLTDLRMLGWYIFAGEKIFSLANQAKAMSQKYHIVVANPPYMSASGMGAVLTKYIRKNYEDSKADLFAVFIERCGAMLSKNSFLAMITQQSWMFLSSFEKLRGKIADMVNMAHLGARAFEEIGGEVVQTTSFIVRNTRINSYRGVYSRLIDANSQQNKEELFLSKNRTFYASRDIFKMVPGAPVAYWLKEHFISNFTFASVGDSFIPKFGMSTGDGNKFIRNWYEVSEADFCTSLKNADDAANRQLKWVAVDKGGTYRKWYGNRNCAVWWKNDGADIKRHPKSAVRSPHLFFKPHVSWTLISSGHFSARYFENGFALDTASNCIYSNGDAFDYILALLNSCVADEYLAVLNPTMNFSCGVISLIPYIEGNKAEIKKIASENIIISKHDWDSFETSWDFEVHPLVRYMSFPKEERKSDTKQHIVDMNYIEEAFTNWSNECYLRFQKLKENEEELNRIFIDIYGLQDELTPEVEDKDVTVRKADLQRDIRSLISYAVGCMFGRYSLDVPCLAYAGGEWDASKYKTFQPDKDAIIPICDDEYFEDDIVGRFVKFIEVVYGKETLEENLQFIAQALGGKGTSREVIRNYFINNFYADHVKVYQKRPIYWLFDSGKKNGFKCLVYMHRYQPDIIARIRTDYVHEQQSRYRTAIADLEQRINGASTSERVKLNKKLTTMQAQATESREYEEKIHHLADQMIRIDLDDGVKHNYEIFKDVLAKIK